MSASAATRHSRPLPGRLRLVAELVLLYLLAPVAVALFLPPAAMGPALASFALVGIGLLHRTPGFRWRELLRNPGIPPGPVVALAAATLAVSLLVVGLGQPDTLFLLARDRPGLLLAILLLYPVLSALPQELVYRPLFFRRYRVLLTRGRGALLANAAAFSLAHLLFWSWTVAVLTFAGGLVFAWAYRERGSFVLAVALHAVAGSILFAVGMGQFFYTGNAARPF